MSNIPWKQLIALGKALGDMLGISAHDFVVLGSEVRRYLVGVGEFAVAPFPEAYRERIDLRVMPAHEGHDGRGVESAGEKRAERHVAYHLQLDGLVEPGQECGDGIALRLLQAAGTAVRSYPVALFLKLPAFPRSSRPGHQFPDAGEESLRTGNVAISQVGPDGLQVYRGLDARHAQQRLDLRRKVQSATVFVEEQRLLAEAVSRQEQALVARVPDREGEHAAQAMDDLAPPVLISAQQHFGVGIAREAVTEPSELLSQLAKVVDFPIEGQREAGLALTFNGEIYNFRELREELRRFGYGFTRDSDTEVLLRAYQHWGREVVHRLRGMFAFAIWDARNERLFLARDRFGEKPLFLYENGSGLYFASEVKALLRVPGVKTSVNLEAVWAYLAYRYVPGPKTLFTGIRKLMPGTAATWERGKLEEERYWIAPDQIGRAHV